MVQTAGVVLAKLTDNPLLAVAVSVVAPAPGAIEVGASKVMVCRVFGPPTICPANVNLPTLA